jgi:class 3 adenylate cyclase/pimeloyl-ACP methyl ester carboxylesterase
MTTVPDVQYARSGDVAIAYQVVGDGPVDLVFVPFFGNVRWAWEQPLFARFLERLASFSRLILFEKRGTGLSDRPRVLTLETQMDDIRAVMDAVGSERAALFGGTQGGQLCALFAASYPERTRRRVLYNPHVSPADVPPAPSAEEARERWGTREVSEELARAAYPSMAGDPAFLRWHVDYLRFAASPGAAGEFFRMLHDTDISDVLPTIRVPTLVIYRARRRDAALRVAELIPGAGAVQIAGDDLGVWIGDEIPAEVERFQSGREEAAVPDSILTTIRFTDIVGSTERAAALGDRRWRDLLARHHAAVRRELARFRGQELDTAGDGFFATFDGPARAIRCAQAIIADVGELGLDLRAGLHTGECELHDGKLAGIAVSVGSRVAAEAGPGEVVVSGTVRDLVAGSGIEFQDLGVRPLKGFRASGGSTRSVPEPTLAGATADFEVAAALSESGARRDCLASARRFRKALSRARARLPGRGRGGRASGVCA